MKSQTVPQSGWFTIEMSLTYLSRGVRPVFSVSISPCFKGKNMSLLLQSSCFRDYKRLFLPSKYLVTRSTAYVSSGNVIGGLCLCFVDVYQIPTGTTSVAAFWTLSRRALKMFFSTYILHKSSLNSSSQVTCLCRYKGSMHEPMSDIKRGHLGLGLRGFWVRSWSKSPFWLAEILKGVFTVGLRLLTTQWRLPFIITHLSDRDTPCHSQPRLMAHQSALA